MASDISSNPPTHHMMGSGLDPRLITAVRRGLPNRRSSTYEAELDHLECGPIQTKSNHGPNPSVSREEADGGRGVKEISEKEACFEKRLENLTRFADESMQKMRRIDTKKLRWYSLRAPEDEV
jgi:hypothetical protein